MNLAIRHCCDVLATARRCFVTAFSLPQTIPDRLKRGDSQQGAERPAWPIMVANFIAYVTDQFV